MGVYVLFWGVYVLYGLPEYNPPGQQLTLYVNVYANKLGSTALMIRAVDLWLLVLK